MPIEWPDLDLPPINLLNAPKQGKPMTEIEMWYEAYVMVKWEDPHQAFGDLCGISRHRAKQRAYEIAHRIYTSELMQGYQNNPPLKAKPPFSKRRSSDTNGFIVGHNGQE